MMNADNTTVERTLPSTCRPSQIVLRSLLVAAISVVSFLLSSLPGIVLTRIPRPDQSGIHFSCRLSYIVLIVDSISPNSGTILLLTR